ncbi:MAG: hypothetical protein KKB61_18760 [Alphaproteobacteria bacterium]|nr:hypothetical protein [Alphaproteobacteria bacterium]
MSNVIASSYRVLFRPGVASQPALVLIPIASFPALECFLIIFLDFDDSLSSGGKLSIVIFGNPLAKIADALIACNWHGVCFIGIRVWQLGFRHT